MAQWTDKDTFKLVRYTIDTYYHAICPGVTNTLKQYSKCGEVLPITTNGTVITNWYTDNYINTPTTNYSALAELIKNTKPDIDQPILVVSIPVQPGIGTVIYCWMCLDTAKTMRLNKTNAIFSVPASDKDEVAGFSSQCSIKSIGTPHIYYDWREALLPITNYFKAVIKYCKDAGKTRRLAMESESNALVARREIICATVIKNNKRFKTIEF